MDKIKLRSILIKSMLACLIVAAVVAVVTILVGKYTDTTGRALGTIFVALLHISIVFGLVSMITSKKTDVAPRATDFVVNTAIFIAVLSFFTSVLAIWQGLSGDLAFKLYATYVVVLFALIHAKTLVDVGVIYKKAVPYIVANFIFIAIVAFMILGAVYAADPSELLDGFYGRLLAASAVVDVTLSITSVVMYRLYLQQNPQLVEQKPNRAHKGIYVILSMLFFFFVVMPFLFSMLSSLLLGS